MGFVVLGSSSSYVSVRDFHHWNVRSQSFSLKERYGVGFKLVNNFKAYKLGRVSLCKSEFIDCEVRTSPNEVRKEIEQCYELIHRLGRGVVYLGSSRMGPGHRHYSLTMELGREIANLLDCTTWTGAGPGLMDAAIKGALQAGKPVGGFKIGREAGEWTTSNFHPYLPSETYLTCRFFSARKHGLVDAAVRSSNSDKTAVVALPGGVGTVDEMFEILALIQLERIGSELPVPFILMNYDAFYAKLLDFLDECEEWGTVSKGEVSSLWKICDTNSDALAYLAEFYDLPFPDKG
ncbi:probable cytokinin riboside 5'-monophosphate phosphoribohydrolase LOGL10 [Durio zibethinus]|uniref:Probable cytokinin riboside 5'-monophosphate phosphoribohydrolase LOGL10 n=1 Tax=Durio zibethinus TaxID=66656 RepID=A0A6P5WLZ2_DURZI|nr:probable cytokinin riboside 5'-monophosphate phosphoribohydrolase LOGL10 [Durio zibethinus]